MVKTNIVVYGFKKWPEAHDYAEKHGIKNPSYGWDMARKHFFAYPKRRK